MSAKTAAYLKFDHTARLTLHAANGATITPAPPERGLQPLSVEAPLQTTVEASGLAALHVHPLGWPTGCPPTIKMLFGQLLPAEATKEVFPTLRLPPESEITDLVCNDIDLTFSLDRIIHGHAECAEFIINVDGSRTPLEPEQEWVVSIEIEPTQTATIVLLGTNYTVKF